MQANPPGYSIVRKIGEGAIGEVFLAENTSREQVVLKVLRAELTTDGAVVGRFLDESKVCQRLSHPNIVRHLSSGRGDDGRVYLVTEHLEGEDLRSLLRSHGPLSPRDLIKLAVPLCEALYYLHQAGVVHRDLKPDNVFLEGGLQAFRPKLLDFGLAYFQGNKLVSTSEGVLLATPEYTPPECINGAKAGARSDLYALGILLFEAATGNPPFVSSNYGELLLKHLHEPAPPLPDRVAVLAPIIHRLLEKDPARRYAGANEVAAALRACTLPTTLLPGCAEADRDDSVGCASSTDLAPEKKGDVLGSYELIDLIGEGSMGRVFLARHVRLGRQVAIKVMRTGKSASAELVHRFFQEARTVNQINHEHIVEVFDFVEELSADGLDRVYCVMELLTGHSLQALLRSGPVSIRRATSMARQVCGALYAAHQVGVVHRDIKPDNIFVTARSGLSDYVKVLDFGVAKLTLQPGQISTTGTQAGMVIGTPTYMAPEQAAGLEVDFRADIYAVGTLLYEMLTGHPPFEAEAFGQLAALIITRPPPPIGSHAPSGERIPSALSALVMRCLDKDPRKRPASMEALAEALTPFAASDAERYGGRRTPTWAIAAAAVAGLAVVGALTLVLGTNSAPPPAALAAAAVLPPPPKVVAPAVPATVQLSVASTPPGARVVRADTGAELGVTPFREAVARLEGEVALRFSLAGFEEAVRTVRLDADTRLEVALAKVPARPAPRPAAVKKAAPQKQLGKDSMVDPFAE